MKLIVVVMCLQFLDSPFQLLNSWSPFGPYLYRPGLAIVVLSGEVSFSSSSTAAFAPLRRPSLPPFPRLFRRDGSLESLQDVRTPKRRRPSRTPLGLRSSTGSRVGTDGSAIARWAGFDSGKGGHAGRLFAGGGRGVAPVGKISGDGAAAAAARREGWEEEEGTDGCSGEHRGGRNLRVLWPLGENPIKSIRHSVLGNGWVLVCGLIPYWADTNRPIRPNFAFY